MELLQRVGKMIAHEHTLLHALLGIISGRFLLSPPEKKSISFNWHKVISVVRGVLWPYLPGQI